MDAAGDATAARGPSALQDALRSAWSLPGPLLVSLSAVGLFVLLDRPLGYALMGAGLLAAWIADRAGRSSNLFPDVACAASGLAIVGLIPLRADISWTGMTMFAVTLSAAVAVPWFLSRRLPRARPITYPWGGWRWSRGQWTYLTSISVVAYLVLPMYFVTSGVYTNWPAIHDPSELARLFVGVNAVGIWDELFFVCTVFTLYRRHFPGWLANVLQAIVFVSFLWELGYQSWGPLLTIPFALVQGAILQLTKNLQYVITVHLLFDLVVFLVLVHAHNPAWPHPFPLLG